MLNFVLMRSAFCRGVACASLSERENELLQYSFLLSVSAKKDRSVTVRFGSRGLRERRWPEKTAAVFL